MFLILALGVTSWIVCGFLQGDLVIIIANSASLGLLLGILYCKLREGGRRRPLNCAAKHAHGVNS